MKLNTETISSINRRILSLTKKQYLFTFSSSRLELFLQKKLFCNVLQNSPENTRAEVT